MSFPFMLSSLYLSSRNKKGSGQVELLGIETSMIKYIEATSTWQIEEVSKNTTAISEATFSSFALGSQNWTIANDNKTCSTKGESYRRRLKLTGCLVGNFTCDDGQCIRRCRHMIAFVYAQRDQGHNVSKPSQLPTSASGQEAGI